MKILYLTNTLDCSNGWGKTAYEIVKGVQSKGIDVITISQGESYDLKDIVNLPLRSFKNNHYKYFNVFADRGKIKRYSKDVDLIHCLVEPFLPLSAAIKDKRKGLILTAHGTYATLPLKGSLRWLYLEAYKKADTILANSNYTAHRLTEKMPFLQENIEVVNLGVTLNETVKPTKRRQDREPVLISVGQIKPRKGTIYIIEALRQLKQKNPDFKLYIIGNNSIKSDYMREVKRRIEEYSLQQDVIFTGMVSSEELIKFYQNAYALVMPSTNDHGHYEGLGLVHLEANSYGLPVIGSHDCGNEDAIIDGYNGFLVPQKNTEQLVDVLLKITHPAFDWDKMSRDAIEHAQKFSWNNVVNDYVDIYKQHLY